MNLPTINAIKNLIATGEIEDAIKEMQKNIAKPRTLDDLILILSQFNTVEREQRLGIIGDADARIQKSRIRSSLLGILNQQKPAYDGDSKNSKADNTTHVGDIIYGNVTKIERQINQGNNSTYNEGK